MTQRVYIHIGPPKTGTTFIQRVMLSNQRRLRRNGVRYARGSNAAHVKSALDLMNKKMHADDLKAATQGEWQRLVDDLASWSGERAVVSQEFLCNATPEQVRRCVDSLAPAEVHIIYTARELSRVIPAMWQTTLRNKKTVTWDAYIRSVREHGVGSWGRRLWRQQDPEQALASWATGVPADRIHVVTVPPPGSPPDLLWRRFCSVLGIDPDGYSLDLPRTNTSLGTTEAEVLRRINGEVGDRLRGRNYADLVKFFVAREVLERRPNQAPLRLPAEEFGWVAKRSQQHIDFLERSGFDIVGDLDDLRTPPAPERHFPAPGDYDERAVLKAMTEVIGAVLMETERRRLTPAPPRSTRQRQRRTWGARARRLQRRLPVVGGSRE